jgi:hypothetical protein
MSTIDSGGGSIVDGGVDAGRDFIGRDQNNFFFLDPVNDAAERAELLARLSANADYVKDRAAANVVADLNDLLQELSQTHRTIVAMISPLRRTSNDPTVFAQEFSDIYWDFRDKYDSNDFLSARTHCHKIRRIQSRLTQRKRLFGTEEQWNELEQLLMSLSWYDNDIIEAHYVPFLEAVNRKMKQIHQLVEDGSQEQAIAVKRELLDALEPEYDQSKAKLKKMTDSIGELTTQLESSPLA